MIHEFTVEIKPTFYTKAFNDFQPCETFTVKGQIEIELRGWGVYGMNLHIDSITGVYEDFETEDQFIFLLSEYQQHLDVEIENGQLMITDLYIDLDEKVIGIS